jgi:hypothetical protein
MTEGPVDRRTESIFGAAALLVGGAIATVIAWVVWAFDAVCDEGCTDGGARSWLSWAQLIAAGGGLLAAALTLIFAVDRRRRAFAWGLAIALVLYAAWAVFLGGLGVV